MRSLDSTAVCGSYNATTSCPMAYNNIAYQNAISLVNSSCSGTTCTSSCMSAVVAADTYAGCCAAKVTCGLTPIGLPVPPSSAPGPALTLGRLRAGVNARQTRQMPRAAGQRGRQTAAT